MKPAQILFFINGTKPTNNEILEASAMPAKVAFRNASKVPNEAHSLEICDGVAGCVPEIYAKAFPSASEAIAKKQAELAKLSEKVGDVKAPLVPKAPQVAPKHTQSTQPAKTAAGAPVWNPNPAG